MRDLKPPFKFELSALLCRAKRELGKRIDGISLNLPFLTINARPANIERQVAKEVVIRLSDKRVLNAGECCDDCIDLALKSLQETRSILVDKQVQLADVTDGPLYLLLEMMLEGIRQFFTFEQRIDPMNRYPGIRLSSDASQQYFAALEMLRAHLHRSLRQVAAIADMAVPTIACQMRYDEIWELEAYSVPPLPDA